MDVVVTGIGLFSALGSLETTWKRLLAGQSGIQVHQPFPELPPKPFALLGSKPAEIQRLTQKVVAAAITDANLSLPLPDCAVVVGSSRGNQAGWERLMRGDSLVNWLDTLPNAASITAARWIGTTSAVLSPMSACATGLWAIAQGVELIQTGQYQQVLAGAVEAPITPLTQIGFERMGALAQTGAYPFDRDREGLVLGEGGAVLVLETAEMAEQRSAKIYGRLLGFGLTADGYHRSAPEPESRAAIVAAQDCLRRSKLHVNDIDFIHTHGTATRLNDRNEAHLIQHLFPPCVPVSSTKGATGHTIGASGAIGAAFCLMALRQQCLPPCVGLRHPEFDLEFITTARSSAIQHAICFSFGFGGQNAAIAIAA